MNIMTLCVCVDDNNNSSTSVIKSVIAMTSILNHQMLLEHNLQIGLFNIFTT